MAVLVLEEDVEVSKGGVAVAGARIRISNIQTSTKHILINKHYFLMIPIEKLLIFAIHNVFHCLFKRVISDDDSARLDILMDFFF